MNLSLILMILISGIGTGGLYGLAAASFSFQLGSLNTINFAYGSVTMLGMYITFIFFGQLGMNILIFLLLFFIIYFFFGYYIRAIFLKNSDWNVQMIITTGISIIIESLVLFIYGALSRNITTVRLPTWKIDMGTHGILTISQMNILSLVLSVVILLAFSLFLKKTWLGMTIRAVVQQNEISSLLGINSTKILNIGFGISFIILAIASFMLALQFPIEPSSGHYFQLISFLITLIAGMGNLKECFFAGILVGIVSNAVNMFAAQWQDPLIFIFFVLVLTFFPHGIFTSKRNIARSV